MRRRWRPIWDRMGSRVICAWNRRFDDRHVVNRRTDLVLEGYPSAANSFAREMLQLAWPGVRIASHIHSYAHVHRALSLKIPVLVLLRPPRESVASVTVRFAQDDDEASLYKRLEHYERFIVGAYRVRDDVALARFEDTVSRLSDVMQTMNHQMGTRFEPFAHETLAPIAFDVIDGWNKAVFGSRFLMATARPSAERSDALTRIQATLDQPRFTPILARCERLHEQLADSASRRLNDWAALQAHGP